MRLILPILILVHSFGYAYVITPTPTRTRTATHTRTFTPTATRTPTPTQNATTAYQTFVAQVRTIVASSSTPGAVETEVATLVIPLMTMTAIVGGQESALKTATALIGEALWTPTITPTFTRTFTHTGTFTFTITPTPVTTAIWNQFKTDPTGGTTAWSQQLHGRIETTPEAITLEKIQTLAGGTPSLMLVADDINITSGSPVTNWVDRMQGITFTQATAGNRPLYYSGVVGGRSVIRNGAGVTQYLVNGSVTMGNVFAPTSITIYTLVKPNAGDCGFFSCRNPDENNQVNMFYRYIFRNHYFDYGSTFRHTTSGSWGSDAGRFNLMMYYRNNVVSGIYNGSVSVLQGEDSDTDGFVSDGNASVTIGMGNLYYLNGDIAFLCIFPRYIAPGSDEDKKIQNSIATYYGLPLYPGTATKPINVYDALGNLVSWINENLVMTITGLVSGPISVTAINDSDVAVNFYPKSGTGTGNTSNWYDTAGAIKMSVSSGGVLRVDAGVTGTTAGFSGNLTAGSTAIFSGPSTFTGSGAYWNDLQFSISSGKVPASSAPTWSAFNGDFSEYSFSVGDYIDLGANELPHSWKEGSVIRPHIHWATGGTDANDRAVKWNLIYSWSNSDYTSPFTTVFSAPSTLSSEVTIQGGVAALTNILQDFDPVTLTGGQVGTIMKLRLRRVAATGTAPSSNPFALQVGVHVENDTLGTRTFISK